MPPNQPGQPDNNGDSDPQRDPNAGGGGRENPYYANQRATAAPDLDANAPQLQSNDMQRLNRKALLFLGGIVALLAVAAFLMFRSATSKEDDVRKQPKAATVNVPDLPETQATLPAEPEQAQPIEVTDYSQQEVPPLPPQSLPPPSYANPYQEPTGPRQPTLMERRMSNSMDGTAQGAESGGANQPNQRDAYMQAMLSQMPGNQAAANNQQTAKEQATSAKFINNPDGLMVRGTYIRCVLETRIITDIPGFTSCVVTEPIYSINGRSLLLPKGSKISGKYNNSGVGDIARVSVIWDRITTPNGIDVNMASPGVDNLGGAGHPGDYNAHWGSRITSALLISIISDAFSYAAAENGPRTTTISNGNVIDTPFESSTARTMERLANQALDRSINRPPTVTINQGTVVNVYVSKDVDFTGVLARN